MSRILPAALALVLLMSWQATPALAAGLDRGDTAWMLTSTALVLMMTIPGLAMFYAIMIFCGLWLVVVYSPIAHMVWGGGLLGAAGVLDYAGGTVVHINAGVAGLVACLVLGPRRGYGKTAFPPHNIGMSLVGAALLWVGWFGLNAGSAVAADVRAGMAMTTTQIATAAAALPWKGVEWALRKHPS